MRVLLSLSILLLFAVPVDAEHCATYTTSLPEIDTGVLIEGTRYYVDNDLPCDPCSIWVYEESNGIDGLQRRDEVHDDTCHGAIPGDTIIF